MKLYRSIHAPIRAYKSWEEHWKGADQGLIACWERGREKASEDPALATRARDGQLVPLIWKGGIERLLKANQKYGTLQYLAMWQGLRGDDLDIETAEESEVVCSATGMRVVFTYDLSKYGNA